MTTSVKLDKVSTYKIHQLVRPTVATPSGHLLSCECYRQVWLKTRRRLKGIKHRSKNALMGDVVKTEETQYTVRENRQETTSSNQVRNRTAIKAQIHRNRR